MKQPIACSTFGLLLLFSCFTGILGMPSSHHVSGQVVDAATGKGIEGAWIVSGENVTRTTPDGRFDVSGTAKPISVRAIGYGRSVLADRDEKRIRLKRFQVRGLYLSFWGVGSKVLRDGVLETARKACLNAVVIDIKGDRGFISYPTKSTLGINAGANRIITIPDPCALVSDLHRRGLYAIARIVVFKDNPLARLRADLAIKTSNGGLFMDREGLAWTDPFNTAVWDYNLGVAAEAAAAGFDEIQFDYVRFPDQKELRFSRPNTEENRKRTIMDFLAQARERLMPYNVFVSADNFGYVCWNLNDTGIGQCFADMGQVVDYISPMLYPSSFQFGIPGLRNPLSDPYRVVFESLKIAKQRTGFSSLTFRPWLQAFSDYAFDRRKFGRFELEQQIKAAQDSGADGWMLWDPRNRYPTDTLSALSQELWSANVDENPGTGVRDAYATRNQSTCN